MPDSIEPSIGRYSKGAEPVPFARVNRVVINLDRRAKGCSVIGAAHKHHVGCASPGRHDAGQHVNVIVSRTTGTINCQETLSSQSCRIDSPATEVAAHVDRGYLVKSRRLTPDLCIDRANAVKGIPFSSDEEVAVGVHVKRSKYRFVRNIDGRLPSDAAISGALKYPGAVASSLVRGLVLEAVPRAAGLIDGEPLLVTSSCASLAREQCPGLAPV